MQRVLVMGASGFSGRHLINRLSRDRDIEVFALSRRLPRAPMVKSDHYLTVDAGDAARMAEIIGEVRPHYAFQLIGLARGMEADLYSANVGITGILLESLLAHSRETKVLLVGSAAEYGISNPSDIPVTEDILPQPVSAYGKAKLAQTLLGLEYVSKYGMHISIARPFNIIGPGQPAGSVVGDIIARLLNAAERRADYIEVGCLESLRDYVAVEDVTDCYCRILFSENPGEIFNICSGKAYSVEYILNFLLSYYAAPVRIEVKNELSSHSPVASIRGDGAKALRLLQFSPAITIDQSLKSAWEHAVKAQDNESIHN